MPIFSACEWELPAAGGTTSGAGDHDRAGDGPSHRFRAVFLEERQETGQTGDKLVYFSEISGGRSWTFSVPGPIPTANAEGRRG